MSMGYEKWEVENNKKTVLAARPLENNPMMRIKDEGHSDYQPSANPSINKPLATPTITFDPGRPRTKNKKRTTHIHDTQTQPDKLLIQQ
jgi:hypothetical protein